jgi:hypothetical protein
MRVDKTSQDYWVARYKKAHERLGEAVAYENEHGRSGYVNLRPSTQKSRTVVAIEEEALQYGFVLMARLNRETNEWRYWAEKKP